MMSKYSATQQRTDIFDNDKHTVSLEEAFSCVSIIEFNVPCENLSIFGEKN